jgi:hypothetical protein
MFRFHEAAVRDLRHPAINGRSDRLGKHFSNGRYLVNTRRSKMAQDQ